MIASHAAATSKPPAATATGQTTTGQTPTGQTTKGQTTTGQITKGKTPAGKTLASQADNQVADLCHLFKILSDENRLRIALYICHTGEQTVTDMCRVTGLRQPLVSHHLARLREAGVLGTRRDGKHVHYFLRRERFQYLMSALSGQRQRQFPCDCFLECMIG